RSPKRLAVSVVSLLAGSRRPKFGGLLRPARQSKLSDLPRREETEVSEVAFADPVGHVAQPLCGGPVAPRQALDIGDLIALGAAKLVHVLLPRQSELSRLVDPVAHREQHGAAVRVSVDRSVERVDVLERLENRAGPPDEAQCVETTRTLVRP